MSGARAFVLCCLLSFYYTHVSCLRGIATEVFGWKHAKKQPIKYHLNRDVFFIGALVAKDDLTVVKTSIQLPSGEGRPQS